MPRSVRAFRAQGVAVIPVGCNYRASELDQGWHRFVPSAGGASLFQVAAHEWLGMAWYWLNGSFRPRRVRLKTLPQRNTTLDLLPRFMHGLTPSVQSANLSALSVLRSQGWSGKREPGENPGLPRSGKRERPPS